MFSKKVKFVFLLFTSIYFLHCDATLVASSVVYEDYTVSCKRNGGVKLEHSEYQHDEADAEDKAVSPACIYAETKDRMCNCTSYEECLKENSVNIFIDTNNDKGVAEIVMTCTGSEHERHSRQIEGPRPPANTVKGSSAMAFEIDVEYSPISELKIECLMQDDVMYLSNPNPNLFQSVLAYINGNTQCISQMFDNNERVAVASCALDKTIKVSFSTRRSHGTIIGGGRDFRIYKINCLALADSNDYRYDYESTTEYIYENGDRNVYVRGGANSLRDESCCVLYLLIALSVLFAAWV